jgi:hypothetical protein
MHNHPATTQATTKTPTPNLNDLDVSMWALGAFMLLVLAVGMWIEHKLDARRIRKLEESHQRTREGYGYRQLWQEREERFWSQLKHSARRDIGISIAEQAEELAAIRAQIHGTDTMDTEAARREIRAKLLA